MARSSATRLARDCRHTAIRAGSRVLLTAARCGGARGALAIGAAIGQAGRCLPPLRERLRANWRAVGIDPTPSRLDAYFEQLGLWAGWSLAIHHVGIARSGFLDHVQFEPETLEIVRDVLGRGRGMVLTAMHQFGVVLGLGGLHHLVHPAAGLIRESKDPSRERIKKEWFAQLGLPTVVRPRRNATAADARACLEVLRRGDVLAVTPDVPVRPDRGVTVPLFGREVALAGGVITLAQRTGAPLIFSWLEWREGTLWLRCDEPLEFRGGARHADHESGMRAWAARAEATLRNQPESWMFWLDKRWSETWRRPPAAGLEGASDEHGASGPGRAGQPDCADAHSGGGALARL